jgi:hypothetical protein
MDWVVKDWANVYSSFAKYIFNKNAEAESMAETIKRMVTYFILLAVGVKPNTDKLPFSKSQMSNQEMASSPIS